MATAGLNTATTKTGDQSEKTIDTVPATTESVSGDKVPASSTDKKDGGETKSNAKEATVAANDGKTNNNEEVDLVTDTQRKIRRAERFGMQVQFSEEEKRNSRAERFGTTSGSHGSDTTKKAEELKRKARAERFGITRSTPTEEEEKKKARLSRFGSSSSSSSSDPIEEEKKKARALRFSGTPINGNGKIEPKATIAGKAGGEA